MTENKELTEDKISMLKKLFDINQEENNKNLQKDAPSFLQVLGKSYNENLISRMLAYLLKKDRFFVWKLLEYCKKVNGSCPENFIVSNVECEKYMSGGRADIFVETYLGDKKYTLTIENKIFTKEHSKQTITYFNYVDRVYKKACNAFLFLKPKFNYSPIECEEFVAIDYNELLNKISATNDYIINDLKKHIEEFLKMDDIIFSDADRFAIANNDLLKEILNTVENKFNSFKHQIFRKICEKIELEYKHYHYISLEKEKRQKYLDNFNGKFIVEIEDHDTSFRLYRYNKWRKEDDPTNANNFYFYVELKFDKNNPQRIIIQELVRKYGEEDSIITKYVNYIANCENFEIDLTGEKCDWENGYWYIFSVREFDSDKEILTPEWEEDLIDKASKYLIKYKEEMNQIFKKFKEWRKTNE